MSLINEALRKARLEASRQQAAQRDKPLPSYWNDPGSRATVGPRTATVLVLALVLVVVAVLSAIAVFRPRTSTDAESVVEEPVSTTTPAGAAPTGSDLATGPPDAVTASSAGDPEPVTAAPADSTQTASTLSAAEASQPRHDSDDPESPPIRAESAAAGADQSHTSATPATSPTAGDQTGSGIDASAAIVPRSPDPGRSPETTNTASASVDPSEAPASAQVDTGSRELAAEVAEGAVEDSGMSEPAVEAESEPDAGSDSFVREIEIPGGGSYRLDGIAWSSDQPFALINGQVVGAGGYVDGAAVAEVLKDRVVLLRDGYRFELRLR
jgi:hypothetical protein